MLRLVTLGGLRIERDGVLLSGAAARKRPLALIALLAAAGRHGISRDKLGACLWAESDLERSRNTLKQTLFTIRRECRQEEIVAGSSELRLNPDLWSCDLWEFDEARASDDLDRADAAYGGAFLDGFHLDGAPEFERWAEAERERLGLAHRALLESLARRASDAGDPALAVQRWRRLAALDPLDSRVTRELLLALVSAGDPAGALRAARVHEALLHEELSIAPDAALVALVASIGAPSKVEAAEPLSLRVVTPALAAFEESAPVAASPRLRGPDRARRSAWLAGAVAASLAVGAAALWRRDAGAMKIDEQLVAIAPFHVAGADSSLAYAREGMVDLLTAALSTTSTLRPLDARATSVAMRGDPGDAESMSRLIGTSRRLHASRLVTGAVVGTTDHLTLTATLTDTRTGQPLATATVAGRADSLAALADGLAVQLLTATLHEPLSGRVSLARRDPVAVRAYLAGQESYRAGRYRDAVARYSAALERDSSFVQAIMGLVFAAGWSGDSYARHRAIDLAWNLRGNLSPADRTHLAAITGPAYPSRPSAAVRLAAWERAAAVAGDRPDVWFALGDDYFHKGYLLGAERPFERADAAFSRALELDSTFVPPLEHRLQLAFYAQDAARSRELMGRYRRVAPMTAENAFIYWRAALAEDDSASLGIIRSALDTMDASSLRWMAVTAQFDGVGLDDARRALDVAARRAATDDERVGVLLGMHSLAANRGRMSEALATLRRLGIVTSHSNDSWRLIVLDAIYAGGDQVAAAEAIRHLAALDARGAADGDSAAGLATSCVVAQWRLAHEDSTGVAAIAARLARAATRPRDATSATDDAKGCSLLLGASLEVRRGDAKALETVRALDDYLQEGPYLLQMGSYAPLALARLYEAAGDRPAALAAVRRRGYFGRWPQQLRAHLDMEARLATSLGDGAGAREATARLQALQR